MNREYHKQWSPTLGQNMELLRFGHAGKPVVVFPCQEGRFYEYEDFGMTEVLRPWIEAGQIQLFCLDSVDAQSWCNWQSHPADRARRHDAYDRYITKEVVPFIRQFSDEPFCMHGCSMGGYHAANYFFRHPEIADSLIAISGLFQLSLFIGDYSDELVYFHTPLAYLANLTDEALLEKYRSSQIFVGVGQGAWEDEMLADTHQLKRVLEEKRIPAVIDIWGHDVNHDWVWWRQMIPHLLKQMPLPAAKPLETSAG